MGPRLRGDDTECGDGTDPTKRKRPWGAGVFGRLSQLGGLGVLLSTWRLWGAGKEPREFRKFLLAHHGRVRVGDSHRRAGLDDARRLGVGVVRTGAGRDTE